jgi:hypothetical protein
MNYKQKFALFVLGMLIGLATLTLPENVTATTLHTDAESKKEILKEILKEVRAIRQAVTCEEPDAIADDPLSQMLPVPDPIPNWPMDGHPQGYTYPDDHLYHQKMREKEHYHKDPLVEAQEEYLKSQDGPFIGNGG